MQNDLNLIWIQCSDKCLLPHLIPADTSRHQWMCVATNFEGSVQNAPAFHSAALCHNRPVYIQIQMRGHFKNIVVFFFFKSEYFHFFSVSFCSQEKKNLKIASKQLPEKWQTLVLCSGNTSLTLNCPRIQCQDYTKCNTETDTTAVRGCETYKCAPENPEQGMLQTGKLTNYKTCFEIFIIKFWGGNFHMQQIKAYKIQLVI